MGERILDNYLKFILSDEANKFQSFSRDLSNGVTVKSSRVGILEFSKEAHENPKKAFIYSCGIHGNETAPIEIINNIVRDIASGELPQSYPLLIIFGHIEAMKQGKRFIQDNLNRMFSDHYKNYRDNDLETARAMIIQDSIREFFDKYRGCEKIHYDLHTAIRPSRYQKFAIYPYLEQNNYSKNQLQIFSSMGIEAVVIQHKPASTLSYFSSSNFFAHSFTLELGKVEKFGDNNVEDFVDVQRVLRELISDQYCHGELVLPKIFLVKKELVRNCVEYVFNISDETANFTRLDVGKIISQDKVDTYVVGSDEERIIFPNGDVKVGQRSGLVIEEVLNFFDK